MPKILLECELPWPPSVNHYWHQVGAGKARLSPCTRRRYHADPQKATHRAMQWAKANREYLNAYYRAWSQKKREASA